MAADPCEQIILGGFAVTRVARASDQQIVTGGFSTRVLLHALMTFAAACRRFLFERATR